MDIAAKPDIGVGNNISLFLFFIYIYNFKQDDKNGNIIFNGVV